MSVTVLVVLFAAVLAGTVVQSVVGLGLGLLAVPVVALVAPQLMPATMVLVVAVLPVLTLSREREDIDWRGLAWAVPPRILGTAVGVWVVATVDDRELGVAVGAMVLAAVLVTVRAVEIPINRTSLVTAGLVSGVTGTTSAIGGPPLAILYQHRPPPQLRSTLSVYFLVGALLSLGGLAIGGEVTHDQLVAAGVLLPALLIGHLLSGPVRRRVRAEVVRSGVLVVCSVGAVALIIRSLA